VAALEGAYKFPCTLTTMPMPNTTWVSDEGFGTFVVRRPPASMLARHVRGAT
jgi:hypothetical protein